MVRAPALPVETFVALSGPDADGSVARLVADPWVRLALAIASPSLDAAIDPWPPAPGRWEHVRRPVIAYLVRMSTRPTPFGLFAGVALGEWGARSDLSTLGRRPAAWRARPDMGWLQSLVASVEGDPAVRARTRLRAHPAVRIRGGRATLADAVTTAGAASLRATPVVREALALCRDGGAPRASVVEALVAAGGRDPQRVEELVETLCECGILVGDLRPALAGDPARAVAGRLDGAAPLDGLLDDIEGWQALPPERALSRWPALRKRARALAAPEPAVQVDAAFAGPPIRLPRQVALEASRMAELLVRLSAWPGGSPAIASWREDFEETYGAGREVPLLDLVDRGLPDLRGAGVRPRQLDRLLLQLAGDALASGASAVELDEATIVALERASGGPGRPPPSIDLYCNLAAEGAGAIDEGRFLLVLTGNGAVVPAGRAFGRFAHVLGEPTRGGRGGSTLAAELLYEPASPRAANVMVRSVPAGHVISLDGSSVANHPEIPLSELAVSLCGSRLRLVWTRAGIDVVAARSHNLTDLLGPPLAAFLHAVSHDGEASVDRFGWGPAEDLPFRPRVQAGRCVLRRAEWSLGRSFVDSYRRDRRVAIAAARLPRHVLLGSVVEYVMVDLLSDAGAELVAHAGRGLTGSERVEVQEALPGPGDAVAAGEDGHRIAELVVPVVCERERPLPTAPRRVTPVPRSERQRPPGSDCLYAKLYVAPDTADEVVAGPLLDLTARLSEAGAIERWFFVRYADPRFHLRVRLLGDPAALRTGAYAAVCDWAGDLLDQGLLERFSFETYEREAERYGGIDSLRLVERIFAADSLAVAQLIAARRAFAALFDPASLVVKTADDLLEALGHDAAERLAWYRGQLGTGRRPASFRSLRPELRALLAEPAPPVLEDVLRERRALVGDAAGALAPFAGDVTRSIVHMHCNRMGDVDEDEVLALAVMTLESLAAWRG